MESAGLLKIILLSLQKIMNKDQLLLPYIICSGPVHVVGLIHSLYPCNYCRNRCFRASGLLRYCAVLVPFTVIISLKNTVPEPNVAMYFIYL